MLIYICALTLSLFKLLSDEPQRVLNSLLDLWSTFRLPSKDALNRPGRLWGSPDRFAIGLLCLRVFILLGTVPLNKPQFQLIYAGVSVTVAANLLQVGPHVRRESERER